MPNFATHGIWWGAGSATQGIMLMTSARRQEIARTAMLLLALGAMVVASLASGVGEATIVSAAVAVAIFLLARRVARPLRNRPARRGRWRWPEHRRLTIPIATLTKPSTTVDWPDVIPTMAGTSDPALPPVRMFGMQFSPVGAMQWSPGFALAPASREGTIVFVRSWEGGWRFCRGLAVLLLTLVTIFGLALALIFSEAEVSAASFADAAMPGVLALLCGVLFVLCVRGMLRMRGRVDELWVDPATLEARLIRFKNGEFLMELARGPLTLVARRHQRSRKHPDLEYGLFAHIDRHDVDLASMLTRDSINAYIEILPRELQAIVQRTTMRGA